MNRLRRLFANLLVALLGFSSIGPAFSAGVDSKLPACCRRTGEHRCTAVTPGAGLTIAPGRCLSFPCAFVATSNPHGVVEGAVPASFDLPSEPGMVLTPACGGALKSLSPAHPKRGPPCLMYSLN
jgi:hypothetical protein